MVYICQSYLKNESAPFLTAHVYNGKQFYEHVHKPEM